MPLSRLRLRLAAWFGCAFLIGLASLNVALYLYLGRKASQRLTAEMRGAASGVVAGVRREQNDPPGRPWTEAAKDAIQEWPPGPEALALFDAGGHLVASRGEVRLPPEISPGSDSQDRVLDVAVEAHQEGRVLIAHDPELPEMTVVVERSTSGLRTEREVLAGWLLASAPLVVLLSLGAGYLLARRALEPIATISQAIAELGPEELDRRLAVRHPPDELDLLADRFNGLLDRLGRSRAANRRFLAQVAHQLKTPLTVVRGESELGLERARTQQEHEKILERIGLAAGQMAHRVNELFLLARAELGERPPLDDAIELDGLALEAADIMRGRASTTRHTLELTRVEPVELRGNEALLREATVELVENACRYATAGSSIGLSTYAAEGRAQVSVTSAGPPLPPELAEGPPDSPDAGDRSLGLSIVRWIAEVHGGRLDYRHHNGTNLFILDLPVAEAGGMRPQEDGANRD